jgi:SAM-dependent methyltransferase
MRALYNSPRLADGYAYGRPPLHAPILNEISDRLRAIGTHVRALDVGCGAGASTAALAAYADRTTGLDPATAMIDRARSMTPRVRFVVGEAERLPFADSSFDLIAAAGSVNYSNVPSFLTETARVLTRRGALVIYDFSQGAGADASLDAWNLEFRREYAEAGGYHLDVARLPFEAAGLRLDLFHQFDLRIPMAADAYLEYAMSETRVELAISRGIPELDIRERLRRSLEPVFRNAPRDVSFRAYVADVRTAIV